MKSKSMILSLLLFSLSLSLTALENSIIPTVEKFEVLENLQQEKYTENQYATICEALDLKSERIRIVSYNVLCSQYDANIRDPLNLWPARLPRVIEAIDDLKPDILGVQELSATQRDDLADFMSRDYTFVSMPTRYQQYDGIYYRTDRFEKVDAKVLNLAVKGGTSSSATLTIIELKDVKTGRSFSVCNTHLAFSNLKKRSFQVRCIMRYIKTMAERLPVVFMGDLNTFPNRPDLNLPFYDGDAVQGIIEQAGLKDAKDVALLGHVGPYSTFTSDPEGGGKPFQGTGKPGVFLDHIYVSDGIQVLIHAVNPVTSNGNFPSDHMPILIDCLLSI